ncbi:MAG: hypothetical protein KF716_14640 [Anaerolineae bacterium]|nr:hypothetical protein [Anaerolineae bacterium]
MTDQIATYTFLPWLRQGIASKIKPVDSLGEAVGTDERATVRISLQLNGDPNFVSRVVQLVGPGDVIGISPRAIVRTEPRDHVTDFESNYLTFIEFYEEDFPWRFTPAHAIQKMIGGAAVNDPHQTKLRPWLFLVALEEGEFALESSLNKPLPSFQLISPARMEDILPPADQAWAWAHVHVSKDVTAGNTIPPARAVEGLQALVHANPDNALSRLICPRKLKPLTPYHAFVIPTFEAGRLAGLGLPTTGIDSLAPSWGNGQTQYPVYYHWSFRTGERGDFEYLVNLLEPREVDRRVGIRDMDMQNPGFGTVGMMTVMGLEGALKAPQTEPKPDTWPPANPAARPQFLTTLADMVNLQDTLLNPADPANGQPDPIISPPLYGRWHALQTRLTVGEQGWVNELNQDPRLRVPAGAGTKVIQTGQEDYMQRAWQQLGDVINANQKIRQVQLSIATSTRVYDKHLVTLDANQQIAVTQQVHARLKDSQTTIAQSVRLGRLPSAAVQPTFRRVLRPRGVVARKTFSADANQSSRLLDGLNTGKITAASPKQAPKQQISLTETAERLPNKRLREDHLTVKIASAIPVRPDFRFTVPGRTITAAPITPRLRADRDSTEGALFRTAMIDLHTRLEIVLPPPPPRPSVNTTRIGGTIVGALNPKTTILQRALSVLRLPPEHQRPAETIVTVMAHPVFSDAMYKPLRDLSNELLIPNLNLIPNNTITLLETNPAFIEAYMVGLNHEMARELLWREYPTDQRGSYFRQFWDVGEVVNRDASKTAAMLEEELRDIKPLHLWKQPDALGTHENRPLPTGAEAGESRLVLVIRGDLLKKYPTAVIFAQKAKWIPDPDDAAVPPRQIRVLDTSNPQINILTPIFKAEVEPDIHFLGFNLTASQAKGSTTPPQTPSDLGVPGWFFVIQERPGEPRFGLDILDPQDALPALEEWNDLSWNHLGSLDAIPFIDLSTSFAVQADSTDKDILWGSNAADLAYILYQDPVMVAIHAENMLE